MVSTISTSELPDSQGPSRAIISSSTGCQPSAGAVRVSPRCLIRACLIVTPLGCHRVPPHAGLGQSSCTMTSRWLQGASGCPRRLAAPAAPLPRSRPLRARPDRQLGPGQTARPGADRQPAPGQTDSSPSHPLPGTADEPAPQPRQVHAGAEREERAVHAIAAQLGGVIVAPLAVHPPHVQPLPLELRRSSEPGGGGAQLPIGRAAQEEGVTARPVYVPFLQAVLAYQGSADPQLPDPGEHRLAALPGGHRITELIRCGGEQAGVSVLGSQPPQV